MADALDLSHLSHLPQAQKWLDVVGHCEACGRAYVWINETNPAPTCLACKGPVVRTRRNPPTDATK